MIGPSVRRESITEIGGAWQDIFGTIGDR
ncbi:hypothetical protein A2U01_0097444, partial [Trifolium medium]|nr:hypothetical protein [Trifolium medium]